MPRRLVASVAGIGLLLSGILPSATVLAASACDPFTTPPEIEVPAVPTAEQALGFAFGTQEVSAAQSDAYLQAVDAASDRVTTALAATSVGGRPIRYAVVGTPTRVTAAGLAAIRANLQVLRNPTATTAAVAAATSATPAILWLSANVHGNEESGADAALDALYQLAARGDCVVDGILADALVVILPVQNPDGREEQTRRNLYGFDMNRDWFARTQPETDGKLEALRQYPPMLYVDAHEFGLSDYFFPPNADPEYHETPDTAHQWIDTLYSPAITSEFDREGIKYFHGAPYDFFATIFGDTVPAVGFHAAGMTFEKEDDDPIATREHEHFTSMWASLAAGAAARSTLVPAWHASFVQAYQEGLAGQLEPNAVFEPKHDLYQPVPDITVRNYFLEASADRQSELQLMVRRLQRMDVTVAQLTAPLTIADYHPYGDPVTSKTFPIGTYWIPMAQAQKHWIQALLHEDPYIPFKVTYDVTAWSNPLLMNLRGGWNSATVNPSSSIVPAQPLPPAPTLPAGAGRIGLFEIPNSTRGFEAAAQTRYLFEQVWHVPYTDVTADDVVAGLAGIDVLVVPDGYANYGVQALGAKGKKALRDWVNAGGRVVAWQGGVEVAVKAGVSTAKLGGSKTDTSGALLRVSMAGASPLASGIGTRDWVMYQDDKTMQPGLGATVASFPARGTADFAASGLQIGIDTLAGSAVVTDEAVGSGRIIAFSVDPNFRAWTQGTQRVLWNALVGPAPASPTRGLLAGSKERAAAEAAALAAANALPDVGSAIRVRVRAADATATAKILNRHGVTVVRQDLGSDVLFLVANKKDLSFEEHPSFGLIVRDLDKAGIPVIAASVP